MKTFTSATHTKPKKRPAPEWERRAERAFKTVAKQVRAEAKLHGLKPLEWND